MNKPIALKLLKNTGHMTEEEIRLENEQINAARKDPEKFSVVYDRYFEGIFQFIYRRTDDEALASDLCSQAFLKALMNLNKYEFRGLPFSAWLYRIASNEVNKHFNKQKRHKVFSLEEDRVKEIFDTNDTEFSEAQFARLVEVLGDMPTEVVEVLELRFFEGKNFREIAFILDIGESGAKMRLYRAVEKLRKHFNVNWENED